MMWDGRDVVTDITTDEIQQAISLLKANGKMPYAKSIAGQLGVPPGPLCEHMETLGFVTDFIPHPESMTGELVAVWRLGTDPSFSDRQQNKYQIQQTIEAQRTHPIQPRSNGLYPPIAEPTPRRALPPQPSSDNPYQRFAELLQRRAEIQNELEEIQTELSELISENPALQV